MGANLPPDPLLDWMVAEAEVAEDRSPRMEELETEDLALLLAAGAASVVVAAVVTSNMWRRREF